MSRLILMIVAAMFAAVVYAGRFARDARDERDRQQASVIAGQQALQQIETKREKVKAVIKGGPSTVPDIATAVVDTLERIRRAQDASEIRIINIRSNRGSISASGSPINELAAPTDSTKLVAISIETNALIVDYRGFDRLIRDLSRRAVSFSDLRVDSDGAGVTATLRMTILAKPGAQPAMSISPSMPPNLPISQMIAPPK